MLRLQIIKGIYLFLLILAHVCTAWAEDSTQRRTWLYASELPEVEKVVIDFHTDTPRDPQIPYLPIEKFPFSPPYTAEEMGIRSMEFPHSPFWDCTLIDIVATVTHTGFLYQQANIHSILYMPKNGFSEHLYQTEPKQELYRWISQTVAPPERYGDQSLFIGYRTAQSFPTRFDIFAYIPALRRIRHQPQLRREDRLPNRAPTVDDFFGRDAWEFSWRILGTDILYETVRFPITKKTVTVMNEKRTYVQVPVREVKLMGEDYQIYAPNGGVSCYVVEAVPKKEWLPNYYLSKLIYWLDKRSFFPLRIEEYDREGNLVFINVRTATRANPQLGERGYAVLFDLWWNIPLDLMTASIHWGIKKEWSEQDKRNFFNPAFMRREWFLEPPKTVTEFYSPDEFFLRPHLDAEKFPQDRKLSISSELTVRIAAQEEKGRLMF